MTSNNDPCPDLSWLNGGVISFTAGESLFGKAFKWDRVGGGLVA